MLDINEIKIGDKLILSTEHGKSYYYVVLKVHRRIEAVDVECFQVSGERIAIYKKCELLSFESFYQPKIKTKKLKIKTIQNEIEELKNKVFHLESKLRQIKKLST